MAEQVNTRSLALDVILAVTRDGEFSNVALKNILDKYRYLPRQDRAFISRVSIGTLEHLIELDYIINQVSKTKVNKMKPVIRCILRSGVYQLKYMDSVPDSAACNEAVKLAVKRGFSGLKGFVNGVMRNISRSLPDFVYPDMQKYPVQALSVRYSMPEWIVERFLQEYGAERCESILRAFLETKPLSVRTNISQISPAELKERLEKQGISVQENPRLSYAFSISGYDTLDDIPEFEEGLFYVQDTASMMVTELSQAPRDAFVLDVCAAPGGKSIHMAQTLGPKGHVEARDLTEYKADLIRENIERCGVTNMSAKVWDASVLDPDMIRRADVVIADLPCSGLGVIGSKTDIKYNASPEKILALAEIQRSILGTVTEYVKNDGILMYSTCTITPEENTGNIQWFLKEHPEYELTEEHQYLPDEGMDGFYIAKLRKNRY